MPIEGMSVEDTAKIHNNPDLNKPFSRPMPLLATCCQFLQLIPQISPKMFVSLSFFSYLCTRKTNHYNHKYS